MARPCLSSLAGAAACPGLALAATPDGSALAQLLAGWPHALGWCAAGLMVATFACRDPRRMRALAVATNLAFIAYGLAAALPPVLALHALLLPLNLWRWAQDAAVRPATWRPSGP